MNSAFQPAPRRRVLPRVIMGSALIAASASAGWFARGEADARGRAEAADPGPEPPRLAALGDPIRIGDGGRVVTVAGFVGEMQRSGWEARSSLAFDEGSRRLAELAREAERLSLDPKRVYDGSAAAARAIAAAEMMAALIAFPDEADTLRVRLHCAEACLDLCDLIAANADRIGYYREFDPYYRLRDRLSSERSGHLARLSALGEIP